MSCTINTFVLSALSACLTLPCVLKVIAAGSALPVSQGSGLISAKLFSVPANDVGGYVPAMQVAIYS